REIVERVNELRRWTEQVESQLGALCTTNGALRCGDRLFGALDRQHELLDPAEADIAGAAAIFRDWTADLAPPDAAEWLVGGGVLWEARGPERCTPVSAHHRPSSC